MQNKRLKQKKYPKFRLLLDSTFAKPQVFTKLYKKAAVKHIRHDFNLSPQAEDEQIYNLAVQKNLFVVTINLKDFRRLMVNKNKPGVLAIDSGLSNKQIDSVICNFISSKNPKDYYGKAIKIK